MGNGIDMQRDEKYPEIAAELKTARRYIQLRTIQEPVNCEKEKSNELASAALRLLPFTLKLTNQSTGTNCIPYQPHYKTPKIVQNRFPQDKRWPHQS